MKMRANVTVIIALLAMSNVASALILPRPENGKLVEVGNARLTEFTVFLTDENKKDLNVISWPRTKSGAKDERVEFYIPKQAQIPGTGVPGKPPAFVDVYDVRQTSKVIINSGEVADLSVESLFLDSASGKFMLGNVFGTIAQNIGFDNEVFIPDLFADTNNDGALGIGDVLYSLVDLNVYMESPHPFALGDTFSIASGVTLAFPGMMFSTTPFIFDSDTGFTGTPFSGLAFADAFHGLQAVPEPESIFLIIIGLVALAVGRTRTEKTERYTP